MPDRTLTHAAFLSLAILASTIAETSAPAGKSYPARYRCTCRAHALLYQPIEKIEWDETPLEDVVDWLRDLGKRRVNILPRWRALSQVGIDETTTVSFTLRDTSVAEILDEVINQLDTIAPLAFQAYDNKFILASKPYFDKQLYLRVYDVTQLVTSVANNGGSSPVIEIGQTTPGITPTGGGGVRAGTGAAGVRLGGSGGPIGQGGRDSGDQDDDQQRQERIDALVGAIENLIEPASWASAGQGRNGTIRVFDNMIFVLNTVEVHEQIAGRFVR